MKPYGPVSVTINTPFKIGIDSSATVVQIHNNTGLSLRLYFGAASPASPTYPSQWHATIDPGAHPVLPVNGSQYFDGTLSFYPYSVQGAQTQQPGVIVASNFVSIEAYFNGETPPQSVYSPVFQQNAAQQRAISVPIPTMGTNASLMTTLTQASAYPVLWDTANFQLFSNVYLRQNPSGGGLTIAFYLHDLDICLEGAAAGYNATYFAIDAVLVSTALAVKAGPERMYHTLLGSNAGVGGVDRVSFTRASPSPSLLTVPVGVSLVAGDLFGIYIVRINTLGTWNLYPNIGWSVDITNSGQLDSYGGGQNTAATTSTNPRTY